MTDIDKGDCVQSRPGRPTPIREIDFSHYVRHYARLIWQWKWWIAIAGPLVLAGALIYQLKFQTFNPELPAKVLIGLENPPTVSAGLDFIGVDNSKAELIKTRPFLKDIVNKLSLRFQVSKFPRNSIFCKIIVDSLSRPGKYEFSIDKENSNLYTISYTNKEIGYIDKIIHSGNLATLNTIDLPNMHLEFNNSFLKNPHPVTFYVTSVQDAIEGLYNNIEVIKPDIRRQQFHIEVLLNGRDYVLIANILNNIADAFVEKKLNFIKRKTQSVLAVLEKQYNKARNDLAGAESGLKNFRTSNPTVGLTQSAQQTVSNLTALETGVFTMESSLKEAQRLDLKIAGAVNEDRIQAAEEILVFLNSHQSTSAPVLQMELNRLISEKRTLQNNYASTHPQILENEAGIENLLVKVQGSLKNFKKNTEEKALEQASGIQSLTKKLQRLPSKEVRLAELQRRHQVSAEMFSTISDRYNRAKVAETIEVADVYVMDYAVPPIPPPVNKLRILGICLLLGIAIALGPAIVFDMINKTVQTEFELQKMTDMVVLESIPKISTLKSEK